MWKLCFFFLVNFLSRDILHPPHFFMTLFFHCWNTPQVWCAVKSHSMNISGFLFSASCYISEQPDSVLKLLKCLAACWTNSMTTLLCLVTFCSPLQYHAVLRVQLWHIQNEIEIHSFTIEVTKLKVSWFYSFDGWTLCG